MKSCDHAAFCGKRMAEGDRLFGCSQRDQADCNPVIGSSPTAPPADPRVRPTWMRLLDQEKTR